MGDTVTLAVVNEGGGRRVVGVKVVVWGGRRGSCRASMGEGRSSESREMEGGR